MHQVGRIPGEDLYIGVKVGAQIKCFPFFHNDVPDQQKSFTGEDRTEDGLLKVTLFRQDQIQRDYSYATDTVSAQHLSFSLTSRITSIPEITEENPDQVKDVTAPAIVGKLEYDNSESDVDAEMFFALSGMEGKQFLSQVETCELRGLICKEGYGFSASGELPIKEFADFGIPEMFSRKEPLPFYIAPIGGVRATVKAGTKGTLDLSFAWYQPGVCTDGLYQCKYWYTNYFHNILEVLEYAGQKREQWWQEAKENDLSLKSSGLSACRQLLVTHATKAYYASTMLFDRNSNPLWAINEGTFMMINTFDLMVDHLFFEMKQNPWVVKNQLDTYIRDYSYEDQCGISFTHDFGTNHIFTPKGYSSYEIPFETGCFSYMTAEQLTNWILCAGVYLSQTSDAEWLTQMKETFQQLYMSLLKRTVPHMDGVMNTDSERCQGGSEITTYDSLDPSLGQSRRSLYLSMKFMASFAVLSDLFHKTHCEELSGEAMREALKCCETINSYFDPELGYIPALLDLDVPSSAIIPAVEGLIYIRKCDLYDTLMENGSFKKLIEHLKTHIRTVLTPEHCLFADGGWKLSENSNNSWMSKIFLCQYIVEEILQLPYDKDTSDKAHWHWWSVGCSSNPAVDQIFDGTTPERGFHYPRSVTNTLWWNN